MLPPLLLFLAAAGLTAAIAAWLIARGALRPRRATAGWALAHGSAPDPGSLGLRYSECGTAEWPAWRIEGSGTVGAPTLILLHGWGRSRIDSLRRVGPLLPHVRAAILPDLPGHGESQSATAVGASEHAALVAELPRWLEAGRHPKGWSPRVILAGHSLGAAVAIRAAPLLNGVATVDGVIAWAPYETARQPVAARLAAQGIRIPALVRAATIMLRWHTGQESSTISALRSLTARSVPTVIVGSSGDRVVELGVVRQLATEAGVARDEANSFLVGQSGHADLGTEADGTTDAVAVRCATWSAGPIRDSRSPTRSAGSSDPA